LLTFRFRQQLLPSSERLSTAIHIRKEQDKSMNQDQLPTNFHTSMTTYCPLCRHLVVDSHSDEGSSRCRNVNKSNKRL